MTGAALFESSVQDIRFAIRMLRKNLVFTLAAVVTLAAGIGGNSAVFSVIRAVLLKPLEYREPGRLVEVSADYPKRKIWDTTFTKQQFDAFRAKATSFSGLGAYLASQENFILSGEGEPEALKGARVSANFLDILGVAPVIGRGFLPEEEQRGGPDVAMISQRLWRLRFAGSAQILGKTANLNSTPYTIIGVLPRDFHFPRADADVWVTKPEEWSAFPPRFWNISTTLLGFGRLKAGVTLEQARAELDVLNRQAARADEGNYVPAMRAKRLSDQVVGGVRETLWMLFGAVGFVLLIACGNVAGLLLARSSSRAREFAIRTAMGAPKGRLIRQFLAESAVLSLAGGAAGLLVARWALSAVPHIAALDLPGVTGIRLDGGAFGFTFGISMWSALLFGLVPALQMSRPDLAGLREGGVTAGRGGFAGRGAYTVSLRQLLVVGQVALSMILLIGAALLMKSFVRLMSVDPGFQAESLLTAKIALPPARYDSGVKKTQFLDELLKRVRTIPGVEGAAVALSLPTTNWLHTNIQIEGQLWDPDPGNWPSIQIQSVTPSYFRTMGIALERGREFTDRDNSTGAQPAIIINESFARRFWPAYPRGQDPVGGHMREGADKTGLTEIVGIVADVHEGSLAMAALPEFYVPCVIHPPQNAYLVVRTALDPLRIASAIGSQLRNLDANETLSDVKTMRQVLESPFGPRRVAMLLAASFSGVAMLLALVGIYGSIAYSVAQRTQEMGVRRALGAQASDIYKLVLGQALALSGAGIAIGVCGAAVLTRAIQSRLFEVKASDPASFLGAAALFIAVALAAAFLPARRAAQLDPMSALRVG
jgi:putative ABC transport system permease protein